jgi:C1A family cysteine protease
MPTTIPDPILSTWESSHPYVNCVFSRFNGGICRPTSGVISAAGATAYLLTVDGSSELNYDFVTVYDSAGTKLYMNTGDINQTVVIKSSSGLKVGMIVDDSANGWGFKITVRVCDGSCQAQYASKDWTNTYTTPVRDQMMCGSCWAFAAAEQLESDLLRVGAPYDKKWLSPQQMIDCESVSYGCDGGFLYSAMDYMVATGLADDSTYPYMNSAGTCQSKTIIAKAKGASQIPSSYVEIPYYTKDMVERNMKDYVVTEGVLAVHMDATALQTYISGILTTASVELNHAVQLVGFEGTGVVPYFKLRNQWGTSWGENGYFRVAYGTNVCGIATVGGIYIEHAYLV